MALIYGLVYSSGKKNNWIFVLLSRYNMAYFKNTYGISIDFTFYPELPLVEKP